MALSNMNKQTITDLFQMLKFNNDDQLISSIKNDYLAFSKLKLITSQINLLHDQANEIINDHKFNFQISQIECNFKKTPRSYYYLYEKDKKYLSLIPPEQWWGDPGKFICKIYYDYDLSFSRIY